MKLPSLELNLARPHRKWRTDGLATLALVGAAALAGAWFIEGDMARLRAANAQLDEAQARARAARPTAARANPAEERAQRALANLQRDLDTPWEHLLRSLEGGLNRDVAVLGVEPTASKRAVRLQLEARNRQSMLGFLESLQAEGRLADVMLLMHQPVPPEAGGRGVRFQVQASWSGTP
ncbi:MAG: hypothetical protein JNL30_14680 [Rubrivivax sp.]|nr:hypothetical protein [Rubrivivax sp.]